MPHWNRVAIIGVGLIGGSVGLALRRRGLADCVAGAGRRSETLQAAKKLGAIDEAHHEIAGAADSADLVVVCTPVQAIPQHVREAAGACRPEALLTDAGSTKKGITDALADLDESTRFCGSHPLAGGERSGPENGSADLFVDRTVVVTPVDRTPEDVVAETTELWTALGAKVVLRSPVEHDRALASTSHLPHLAASALAAATPPEQLPLTASGWADCTRIAAGDVQLWRQILSDNRDNTLEALERLQRLLNDFRVALEQDDQELLTRLLEQGKSNRDAVGS